MTAYSFRGGEMSFVRAASSSHVCNPAKPNPTQQNAGTSMHTRAPTPHSSLGESNCCIIAGLRLAGWNRRLAAQISAPFLFWEGPKCSRQAPLPPRRTSTWTPPPSQEALLPGRGRRGDRTSGTTCSSCAQLNALRNSSRATSTTASQSALPERTQHGRRPVAVEPRVSLGWDRVYLW